MVAVGEHVNAHLERKAQFILAKLQDVITSTEIAYYPELSDDLKACVASYFDADLKTAEEFMDRMERDARMASNYTN